jgi:hypothetical protein
VEHGYYHGYGVSAAGALTAAYGPFELGGRARFDSLRALEGFDEKVRGVTVPIVDQRAIGGAFVRFEVPRTGIALRVELETRRREGHVGGQGEAKDEVAFTGTTGWRF